MSRNTSDTVYPLPLLNTNGDGVVGFYVNLQYKYENGI